MKASNLRQIESRVSPAYAPLTNRSYMLFAGFLVTIIVRSVYFTNGYIAGLQSVKVERWSDFFIPLLTVFIHLLLLRYLPMWGYRIVAVLDFLIETGLATYYSYFSENIDIHAILSSSSEGAQVARYIVELVPKIFFLSGAVLILLQLLFAPQAKRVLRRGWLAAMAVIVLPLFAFAVYKVPFQKAKNVVDYPICIKLYGFYTAMASDLIFSGKTPSDQELRQELVRRNQQYPIEIFELPLPGSKVYEDLLAIQVETLDFNLLGFRYQNREVTPFLNRLRQNSILLKLNALHGGPSGSSGADFQFLTGLLPPLNYPAFKLKSMDYRRSLPALLKSRRVPTFAFHGNTASMFGRGRAYQSMGVTRFYDPADFPEDDSRWGIGDRLFFNESAHLIHGANEKNEFYFMITLSSHGPFDNVHHDAFETRDLPAKYFNSLNYVDGAIANFFPKLRGNYLVLMYGDHTAGLRTDYYVSRERGNEYVPGFIFFVVNGEIIKPNVEAPQNALKGIYDIRSMHHFALNHFPPAD